MTSSASDDRPAALPATLARARLGSCTVLVLLVALLAATTPTLARPWMGETPAPLGAWIGLGLGALLLGVATWRSRRLLLQALASLEFSIVLLSALLLCTMAGTLILQKAEPAEYVARYGEDGAALVTALGADDLFHTPWFSSLLGLLAVSLVATLVRTRSWRPDRWGHLLAHGGVVVLLGGGLVGALYGGKGMVELREGQSVDRFVRSDEPGLVQPLGFTLRLDRFELEHHADVWRVFQYEQDGLSWRARRSWVPHEADDWLDLGPGAGTFRVTRLLPEARRFGRPWAAEQGAAALSLHVMDGDDARRLVLLDGVAGQDGVRLPGGLMRFAWEAPELPDAAPDNGSGEDLVAEHVVAVGDGPLQELAVQPGRSVDLPGGEWVLTVEAFLPDFSYDSEARQARTASWEPKNPALAVVLTPTNGGPSVRRWLFAHMPDWESGHAGSHGEGERGPRLVYSHHPEAVEQTLLVGATRELWRLRAGRVLERLPLEARGDADDGLLLDSAALGSPVLRVALRPPSLVPPPEREALAPLPGDATDPGAVIELRHPDGRVGTHLVGVDPIRLPDGSVLLLDERGDGIQAFISHVSVLVDGRVVDTREVRVNQPLAWGDLHIYQQNYRRDDLAWSGFLVVDDPGLDVVFVGMTMMVLGVAYLLLVRPRLLQRRTLA